MAGSQLVGAGQRQTAARLPALASRHWRCRAPAVSGGARPRPMHRRQPAIAAKASGTAKGNKPGRAVMLREKAGAPITVLEPANYWSTKTEDYEFLIAVQDGKLNLSSSFIVDDFTGISSRPVIGEGVPDKFVAYMEIPWLERDTGDLIMDKKPREWIPKFYYLETLENMDMNLDAAYMFHVEERSFTRVEVEKGEGWDDEDAFLRIMDDGRIVIQSTESTPTPEQLVREKYAEFVRNGGEGGSPMDMEDMEEDEDIEFDLDVPDIDMS